MRREQAIWRNSHRFGFSMIESLIAVTITATAGAALLTSIASAMSASRKIVHQTIARGLADQLMDEIAATRFPAGTQTRPMRAKTRKAFDDMDDYDQWVSQPPQDRQGHILGTEGTSWKLGATPRLPSMRPNMSLIQRFRREVVVEPIVADQTGGWRVTAQNSDLRRVTVFVYYVDAQGRQDTLCQRTRVFNHAPFTP